MIVVLGEVVAAAETFGRTGRVRSRAAGI